MIKHEKGIIENDTFITAGSNQTHCRHISDSGFMIQKVGTNEIYSEAVDILPCRFEYVETDKPIEQIDDPDLENKAVIPADKTNGNS